MRRFIRNVRIFDGQGTAPFAGAVLIEQDRIAAVLRDEAMIAATTADQVIDGQGGMRTAEQYSTTVAAG